MTTLVCDIDGVLYRGDVAIAGSGEALERLRADGVQLLFATNSSARTPERVVEKIARVAGFHAKPEDVLTSALAAAELLADEAPLTFVVGGAGINAALDARSVPVTEDAVVAEAVVVGIDPDFDYGTLRAASAAVRRGARFVATNMDATFPADGGLLPGAGSIVAPIAVASGVSPEVAGKPHATMRLLVKRIAGPGPIWVVGDRPDTDIALAKSEGWGSILVLSGITEHAENVPVEFTPDAVVPTLAEVDVSVLRAGGAG